MIDIEILAEEIKKICRKTKCTSCSLYNCKNNCCKISFKDEDGNVIIPLDWEI